jgi:predicted TIM-barrel fold metal-dependent hydrolase
MQQQKFLVDVHTHYLWMLSDQAREFRQRVGLGGIEGVRDAAGNLAVNSGGVPMIVYKDAIDIEKQVAVNQEAGITRRLLSVSMMLELFSAVQPEAAPQLARVFNDGLAEIVRRYPEQLEGLGTVCALDPLYIAEAKRCVRELGFKGILIDTSWHGEFLDGENAYPFWSWVEENQVPVFLHPPALPIGHEKMNRYKLEEAIGRPFDTTMCVAQLILSGVLDRFPGPKLVLAHMGGALASVIGRLDMGHRLGYDGMPNSALAKCRLKPSDYLRRNFWVDTMGFNPEYLLDVIDLVGANRVMLGTDYGPVPISPLEHVEIVRSLQLGDKDEAGILWKNADRLFGLRLAECAAVAAK